MIGFCEYKDNSKKVVEVFNESYDIGNDHFLYEEVPFLLGGSVEGDDDGNERF